MVAALPRPLGIRISSSSESIVSMWDEKDCRGSVVVNTESTNFKSGGAAFLRDENIDDTRFII